MNFEEKMKVTREKFTKISQNFARSGGSATQPPWSDRLFNYFHIFCQIRAKTIMKLLKLIKFFKFYTTNFYKFLENFLPGKKFFLPALLLVPPIIA